jgi:hypothetical protein
MPAVVSHLAVASKVFPIGTSVSLVSEPVGVVLLGPPTMLIVLLF